MKVKRSKFTGKVKSRFKYTDTTVIKTINDPIGQPINKQWLEHYDILSSSNPALVKVFEIVNQNTYIMERLDVAYTIESLFKKPSCYHLITKDLICDVIVTLNDTWSQSINASKELPGNTFFVSADTSLSNMVLTTAGEVKIIDPESFQFVKNLQFTETYYMSQINLMSKLQCYYAQSSKSIK